MPKVTEAFKQIEGGLFSEVEKADVGNAYQELGKKGVDLMGWADPFFPDPCMPEHVQKAALDAVNSSSSAHYTAPVGNDELKRAIASKLERSNGLSVHPERNLLITPGSDSGLFYSMMPFISPGDEAIIPAPCYPNNIQNIRLLGGIPVHLPLKEEQAYQLSAGELETCLTPRSRMVILTHPNNPTTTVFNRASLKLLSEFVIKNNLILICDQAFEDFTFEHEFITPASLPGMFEHTISVFSTSKGMGLSGFRVGYIAAGDKFMDKYYGAAVSVLGATNTVAQLAVLAAFRKPEFMAGFESAYDYRRKAAFELINQIPNVSMQMPESGFLGWVDVSKLGTSPEIQRYLIEEAKVCVNDGINYGIGGEGHLRIVLGTYRDNDKVIAALNRIKIALTDYPVKLIK